MGKLPLSPSPEDFWTLYSARLLAEGQVTGCHQRYKHHPDWTPVAMKIAKDVCEKPKSKGGFGLKVQAEYMNIDLIAYERDGSNNWCMKVAFEHENMDNWDDELCKLCHVVCDLRVIATYFNFDSRRRSIDKMLQKRIDKLKQGKELEDRMARFPGARWLFIIGPRCRCESEPYRAFTTDADHRIMDITHTGSRLVPAEWA